MLDTSSFSSTLARLRGSGGGSGVGDRGVGDEGGDGASNSDRLMSQIGRRFSFCEALRALSGLEFNCKQNRVELLEVH